MGGPTVLSWSGGKDSAMALHALRDDVVGLVTTVNDVHRRVVMQGVREDLVRAQAASLGIELHVVLLPAWPSNEQYEAAMADVFDRWKQRGVARFAFGDLFLDDIRSYREGLLARAGVEGVFPVWTGPAGTEGFMRRLLELGYRAVVVALDPRRLDRSFAGREVDADLLADLPPDVDPAGENGEFHTFVWDGPGFAQPVGFSLGETVERDGFVFRDLVPSDRPAALGSSGTASGW